MRWGISLLALLWACSAYAQQIGPNAGGQSGPPVPGGAVGTAAITGGTIANTAFSGGSISGTTVSGAAALSGGTVANTTITGGTMSTTDASAANALATAAVIPRSMAGHASDRINVQDFGAVGDGAVHLLSSVYGSLAAAQVVYPFATSLTNDLNMMAVQLAINTALSTGINRIYFPHGTYNFSDTTTSQLNPGAGNLEFSGDDKRSTILKFTGGTAAGGTGKGLFYNTSGSAGALKGYLTFRDMTFQGSFLDVSPQQNEGNVSIFTDYYSSLNLSNVRFYAMNFMAIDCHFIPDVIVTGCEFDTCSRDMLRITNAFNATVVGNTFRHGGDDAIALHTVTTSSGPGLIREGITITGNVFEDIKRIAVLGARMVNISDNIMRRCVGGITCGIDSTEGANQIFGVHIVNNQLYDLLVLSGSNIFQSITVIPWLPLAGTTPFDTSGAFPGNPAVTSGTVIVPYDFRDTNSNNATDALAYSFAIRVTGNTIARTLPAADGTVTGYNTYSDWGFGEGMTSTGFVNPAVSVAMLTQALGIQAEVSTLGLMISNNYIADCAIGIFLGTASPAPIQSAFWIENNHFYNITTYGIEGANSNAALLVGQIRGNFFNMDPFYLNSLRGANGTWTAATSAIAIAMADSQGLVIAENIFMNLALPTNMTTTLNTIFIANKVRSQFSGTAGGFNNTNRGVGYTPLSGVGWYFEYIDATPGSSTFGQLFNTNPLDDLGTGLPVAGLWIRGHFLRSQNPVSTNAFGWYRLTSGSSQVIGTDWAPVLLSGLIRNLTTDYTLVAADNGRTLFVTDGSTSTITVPTGLGITFQVSVVQAGSGKVTFTTSGTTINAKGVAFSSGSTGTSVQWGEAKLRSYATDTYALNGDVS